MAVSMAVNMAVNMMILFFIAIIFIIPIAYADEKKSFDIDGYSVTTFDSNVKDIKLSWGEKGVLPSGDVSLDEIFTGDIFVKIPKEMPRTTYLDLGDLFYAVQDSGDMFEIEEIEMECFYLLKIPFRDSDSVKIIPAPISLIPYEIVTIASTDCGDPQMIRPSLKTQIESRVPIDEIECKNESHVLVQRADNHLACVLVETATVLGWQLV